MSKENEKKEPTVKKTVKPKAKRSLHGKVKVVKYCGCGCGAEVTRRFKSGHDQILRSQLLKTSKNGSDPEARIKAQAKLKALGWV